MKERTLAIIKPDGVARGLIGEVIKRIEADHLDIIEMKRVQMTGAVAQKFYAVHNGKPFFGDLVRFMCSGPVVVMLLEGVNAVSRWRNLMGATYHKDTAPGTIRRDFADPNVVRCNVVHGSDGPETADVEISIFFTTS